eukprot:2994905-Pyramimonas_sp.AAC.1
MGALMNGWSHDAGSNKHAAFSRDCRVIPDRVIERSLRMPELADGSSFPSAPGGTSPVLFTSVPHYAPATITSHPRILLSGWSRRMAPTGCVPSGAPHAVWDSW